MRPFNLIALLALLVGVSRYPSITAAQQTNPQQPAAQEVAPQAAAMQDAAQQPAAQGPSSSSGMVAGDVAASTCAEACAANMRCVGGRCILACNPPCFEGMTCTNEGECLRLQTPAVSAPDLFAESLPRTLPYDDGPTPEGYRLQSRSTVWMWAPGIAVFAATYASSLAIGMLAHGHPTSFYIQLAGPFIAAADNRDAVGYSMEFALGAGQIVGAALIISGLAVRKKQFVRIAELDLDLSPTMFGANKPGLSLHGRF